MMVAIGFAYWELRGYHSFAETCALSVVAVGAGMAVSWLYPRMNVVAVAIAVAAVVAGVAVPFGYGWRAINSGPLAYREVEEIMADPDRFMGDELKLHGQIELGSLHSRYVGQTTEHTFVIAKHHRRVVAHYVGALPDTMQDRAEVVALGRLAKRDGVYSFDATDVIAKCPSTYDTADGPVPASKFR